MRFLIFLLRVFASYLVACVVAGFTISILAATYIYVFTDEYDHQMTLLGFIPMVFLVTIFTTFFVISSSFIPSLLFIIWSELGARNGLILHLIGGLSIALMALFLDSTLRLYSSIYDAPVAFLGTVSVIIPGGVTAGAVYWALSGGFAGEGKSNSGI